MSKVTNRTLHILRLFTPAHALWTVDDLAVELGLSSSSAYRYVQELRSAGFLDRVHGGYALGPALIGLDYLIRTHDPLIRAAAPLMRLLLETTTQRGTIILCRRCRDYVMCIHQEQGDLPHRRAGYERGVAMPLFTGATSRIILANETLTVQRRTYLEHETAIQAAGDAANWKEFAALANRIKAAGYAESTSEVTPGLHGIAAPVFQDKRIVAALSLVSEVGQEPSKQWPAQIIEAAGALSISLASADLLVAR